MSNQSTFSATVLSVDDKVRVPLWGTLEIQMSLISRLLLEDNSPAEICHWPMLLAACKRRFAILSLLAGQAPDAPHAGRFLEILTGVKAASPAWSTRFFNDIATVQWAVATPLSPNVFSNELALRRLSFLVGRRAEAFQPLMPDLEEVFAINPRPHIVWPGDTSNLSSMISADLPEGLRSDQIGAAPDGDRMAGIIDAVLREIQAIWPTMARAVATHLRVLFVTPHTERSELNSRKTRPGIVLTTQKSVKSLKEEDLIHETVHQMLFCLESAGAFQSNMDDFLFTSDWSGRKLRGSVYTHLPAVYFLIAEYYFKKIKKCPSPIAQARLRELIIGLELFFQEQVGREYLSEVGACLHDEIHGEFRARRDAWKI